LPFTASMRASAMPQVPAPKTPIFVMEVSFFYTIAGAAGGVVSADDAVRPAQQPLPESGRPAVGRQVPLHHIPFEPVDDAGLAVKMLPRDIGPVAQVHMAVQHQRRGVGVQQVAES